MQNSVRGPNKPEIQITPSLRPKKQNYPFIDSHLPVFDKVKPKLIEILSYRGWNACMLFINRFWFDDVLTFGVLNFPFYSQGLSKMWFTTYPRPENFIVIEIRTWAASIVSDSDPYSLHFFPFIWNILFPSFCLLWLINVCVHKKYTISTVSLSYFLSSSFYLFFLFFSSIHLKFSFYCRVIKIIHPKYKSHFNVILANQTICFFSAPFLLLFGV